MAYEDEISEVIQNARPRCSTCKWWRWRHMDDELGYDGPRPCVLTELNQNYHPHPESKAKVDADYEGILLTSMDFGCVQHEPRKDAT